MLSSVSEATCCFMAQSSRYSGVRVHPGGGYDAGSCIQVAGMSWPPSGPGPVNSSGPQREKNGQPTFFF
eukprot:scaffold33013_cov112-Isochrysis_galbana.AAC.2